MRKFSKLKKKIKIKKIQKMEKIFFWKIVTKKFLFQKNLIFAYLTVRNLIWKNLIFMTQKNWSVMPEKSVYLSMIFPSINRSKFRLWKNWALSRICSGLLRRLWIGWVICRKILLCLGWRIWNFRLRGSVRGISRVSRRSKLS